MDGIYFIVLLGFGALTGALLALCASLGAQPPSEPSGKTGADERGR